MADNITAYPLQGYSTYSLPNENLLLELHLIAKDPANGDEVLRRFPVQMSASQATELARALTDAATASQMGQSPSEKRN